MHHIISLDLLHLLLVATLTMAPLVDAYSVPPSVLSSRTRCHGGIVSTMLYTSDTKAFSSGDFTSSTAMINDENLVELDSLVVKVIVDNDSDTMSSGLKCIDGFQYTPEKQSQEKAGTTSLGLCNAGHGFSVLLEASCGDEARKRTLLFDAGPDPTLWNTNAEKLGVQMDAIEAVVLSHYHWDHSGGLRGAVSAIVKGREQSRGQENGLDATADLLVDLHTSEIIKRGRPIPNGNGVVRHSPDNPSSEELAKLGALNVELHDEPHFLFDNHFAVSGYIPRITEYERGIPNHMTLVGNKWIPDTEIRDERYVACRIRGRGIVVLSACSHAGINNVCRDALNRYGDKSLPAPLFGVVGGFHLGGVAVEDRIEATVEDLKELHPAVLLPGHCTGWRAKARLATEMPHQTQPLAVGGTYTFLGI